MPMRYELPKDTANIQHCCTNRISALLSFQTLYDSSQRADDYSSLFV